MPVSVICTIVFVFVITHLLSTLYCTIYFLDLEINPRWGEKKLLHGQFGTLAGIWPRPVAKIVACIIYGCQEVVIYSLVMVLIWTVTSSFFLFIWRRGGEIRKKFSKKGQFASMNPKNEEDSPPTGAFGGTIPFFPKFDFFFVHVITFFLFFCANNYYTSLLLIVSALRWYVKSLYRHFFLEDIAKHARITQKMAFPNLEIL